MIKHTIQKFCTLSVVALLCTFSFISQAQKSISMKMETNRVHKGKLIKIDADIFYTPQTGEMVTHYKYPMEYVVMANKLGEAKIYYPQSNEVQLKQDLFFSSDNSLIHQFAASQNNDFGLNEMGFTLYDTQFEDNTMITKWYPPTQMLDLYSEIELVYKDNQPIYSAYVNAKKEVARKIFYSEYAQLETFMFPCKITEYSYINPSDSVVSRMIYSDIRFNQNITDPYHNFKIPENAKLIK